MEGQTGMYQKIINDMKMQLVKENKIVPQNDLEFVVLMSALRNLEKDLEIYQMRKICQASDSHTTGGKGEGTYAG